MSLDISYTHQDDDRCIFHLTGRLDAHEAPTAYDRMIAHLGERTRVVLDLEGLDYISSGGISILIRLAHHLRQDGGDLHLAAPQSFVRKVFDIVSFDSILRIFPDLQEASDSFASAP
jgi:anti-anti-sigma factor